MAVAGHNVDGVAWLEGGKDEGGMGVKVWGLVVLSKPPGASRRAGA